MSKYSLRIHINLYFFAPPSSENSLTTTIPPKYTSSPLMPFSGIAVVIVWPGIGIYCALDDINMVVYLCVYELVTWGADSQIVAGKAEAATGKCLGTALEP